MSAGARDSEADPASLSVRTLPRDDVQGVLISARARDGESQQSNMCVKSKSLGSHFHGSDAVGGEISTTHALLHRHPGRSEAETRDPESESYGVRQIKATGFPYSRNDGKVPYSQRHSGPSDAETQADVNGSTNVGKSQGWRGRSSACKLRCASNQNGWVPISIGMTIERG